MPSNLATGFHASTPIVGTDPGIPLNQSLSTALANLHKDDCPLLFYPVDGFVALVQVGSLLEASVLHMFNSVWLRTLFSLAQKHYALYLTTSKSDAEQRLFGALSRILSIGEIADYRMNGVDMKVLSISIIELDGTYLLPIGKLETFQRLGGTFLKIQSSCASAITSFLHILLENMPRFTSAETFFCAMKQKAKFQKVFWDPADMDED